jgi:glutaminase
MAKNRTRTNSENNSVHKLLWSGNILRRGPINRIFAWFVQLLTKMSNQEVAKLFLPLEAKMNFQADE